MNTAVSPSSSQIRMFRQEDHLQLKTEIPHGRLHQCLHDKSGSHGVPTVNLFDFVSPGQLWYIFFVKFCDLLRTSPSKTQKLFQKKNIF